VTDWIIEALHQSHADEKRFREDAITRLQDEQSKIQNRLDRLYDDRLDGYRTGFLRAEVTRVATDSKAVLLIRLPNTKRLHMIMCKMVFAY